MYYKKEIWLFFIVVYYVMGINIYKIISKEVKIDYWE